MLSLKNRKTPVQNKKDNETWESIALHYFLVYFFVFCGYGLYFSILFQFCGLILYFFSVFPVGDAYFRMGICVSVFWWCFSVLGFRFVYVFLFWVCSLLFLLLLLSCGFFCFYRPPYIFDRPLHLNPTTGEHFKTPSKISSQISNRSGKK